MKGLTSFTIKNLKQNKKRTIVTFIGIMLTSSLLFGVGLFISTYRDNLIKEIIRESGSHHIEYQNLDSSKLEILKSDHDVKKVVIETIDMVGILEKDDKTIQTKVISIDEDYSLLFNLIEGTTPQNKKEIILPLHFIRFLKIEINDTITIYNEAEKIEYKVVGIYSTDEDYDRIYTNDITIYTKYLMEKDEMVNAYITLENPKGAFSKLQALTNEIGLIFPNLDRSNANEQVVVNTSLLAFYGQISDNGVYAVLFLSTLLILAVLGLVCILIIYNSFSISVMERKKQLGILASLGASPIQILKSVFIEAGIISLFAIPFGFMVGLINVSLGLLVINKLLEDIIIITFTFSIYPFFIGLAFLFILLVIFFSALFPAMRAREVSPLEAIKLNKDLKMKKERKIRNKLIFKLFKLDGLIAYKNVKRQSQKYRITIVSLVVSIVLFVVSATFINGIIFETGKVLDDETNYDASVHISYDNDQAKAVELFKKIKEVKKVIEYKSQYVYSEIIEDKYYNKKYLERNNRESNTMFPFIRIVLLNNTDYQNYKKKIKLTNDQPILVNYGSYSIFDETNEKANNYKGQIYQEDKNLTFNLCNYKDEMEFKEVEDCYYQLKDLYFTNQSPFFNDSFAFIVVNQDTYNYISENKKANELLEKYDKQVILEFMIKKAKNFDKEVKKIIKQNPYLEFDYWNPKLENHQRKMVYTTIMFILYSLNIFILLIGITSVINTVNTNINLRKQELAILRSAGQSFKSFNKMIMIESLFISLKALFYGLSISVFILYLIQKITSLSYGNNKIIIPIPITTIIICLVINITIVFLTMKYATNKLKSENIIDVIKKEII